MLIIASRFCQRNTFFFLFFFIQTLEQLYIEREKERARKEASNEMRIAAVVWFYFILFWIFQNCNARIKNCKARRDWMKACANLPLISDLYWSYSPLAQVKSGQEGNLIISECWSAACLQSDRRNKNKFVDKHRWGRRKNEWAWVSEWMNQSVNQ